MAPRSFWKGYLKLSLVTCPVAMVPATTDNEKVKFHTLNEKTGNRVVSQYVDAVTGKVVEEDEQVKGFERGENEYVILEEDEIESVGLESTRTIDIEMFVPKDNIQWIWYDKPHYLTPDAEVGEEAFSVIRDAMKASGKVGIARLVMYRRERAVMLEARGKGIVLWTLRYGDEVRKEDEYFSGIKTETVSSDLLNMVEKLIESKTKPWDASFVDDPVQNKLLEIISSRKKGKKPATSKESHDEEKPSNVVNIMDALKKSLAGSAGKAKSK